VRARRELNNHDPIDSINVLHPGCDNASWSATSCDEKSRRRAARHGAQRRADGLQPAAFAQGDSSALGQPPLVA
jgi:hypothetical protein